MMRFGGPGWLWIGLLATTTMVAATAAEEQKPPNVVIVYVDDMGYGDASCFGSDVIATPRLDRMAREGTRFTSFYVAQAVCSASRTALLTGCYPNRVGILGALNPDSKNGIHDEETTLGEVFKSRGYATGIVGKWHLGHHPRFLPTRHGFDSYFGIPYSNDMTPGLKNDFPPVPLYEDERVVERAPSMNTLTRRYTERAVAFIEKNRDKPFFLYLAHTMPHVPLGVSDQFAGSSKRGLYGDVIQEIDWSVGQLLDALARLGLDEQTLMVFASDNGPWLIEGDHGGVAGPLREGKGTTFEGGVRVPGIARWPGRVRSGVVSAEPIMTIDLLPTLAGLIGADLPKRPIDGLDARGVLLGEEGAKTPHEAFFFYWGDGLQAVRSGRWKLHFPHPYRTPEHSHGTGGKPAPAIEKTIELSLFDLEADLGETTNVAADHPEVVARLQALAETMRGDLGDSARKQPGVGKREPGRVAP